MSQPPRLRSDPLLTHHAWVSRLLHRLFTRRKDQKRISVAGYVGHGTAMQGVKPVILATIAVREREINHTCGTRPVVVTACARGLGFPQCESGQTPLPHRLYAYRYMYWWFRSAARLGSAKRYAQAA